MRKRAIGIFFVLSFIILSSTFIVSAFSFFDFWGKITGNVVNEGCPSDLVAYYKFDGNANDASGNGNNGNVVGSVNSVSGKIGQAYSFDGSGGNYISRSASGFPSGSNARTLSAWFKMSDASLCSGATCPIVSYGQGTGPNSAFGIIVEPHDEDKGKIRVGIIGSNDLNVDSVVDDGQWHHAVAVYDSNTIYLYLDGNLIGSKSASINTGAGSFYAGTWVGNAPLSSWLNGQIDEIALYDEALSASQVSALYNDGNGRAVCSSPVQSCTENWACSNWSICANNQQTRTCSDGNSCGTINSKPNLTQNCTIDPTEIGGRNYSSGPLVCSGNYTASCIKGYEKLVGGSWECVENCACENLQLIQSCQNGCSNGVCLNQPISTCTENWTCGSWGDCIGNSRVRNCVDNAGCGTNSNKPSLMESCNGSVTPPTNPSCQGCMHQGTCLPVGYRLLVNEVPSYCDVFGIREQKVNTENITQDCQNDYECDTGQCSSGKCVNLEGFKAVLYKILCKVTNFLDSDAEARCVAQYIYGVIPENVCGNGAVDSGEQCDGSNLNGQNCTALGFNSGTLTCNSTCGFDASSCSGGVVDLCAGVTCPTGQVCDSALGRCVNVDPNSNSCTGVTCDSEQVCDPSEGQCVESVPVSVAGTVGIRGTVATFDERHSLNIGDIIITQNRNFVVVRVNGPQEASVFPSSETAINGVYSARRRTNIPNNYVSYSCLDQSGTLTLECYSVVNGNSVNEPYPGDFRQHYVSESCSEAFSCGGNAVGDEGSGFIVSHFSDRDSTTCDINKGERLLLVRGPLTCPSRTPFCLDQTTSPRSSLSRPQCVQCRYGMNPDDCSTVAVSEPRCIDNSVCTAGGTCSEGNVISNPKDTDGHPGCCKIVGAIEPFDTRVMTFFRAECLDDSTCGDYEVCGSPTECPRKCINSCGDGKVNRGDSCDGEDLDGKNCASATNNAKPFGKLACTIDCLFEIEGCRDKCIDDTECPEVSVVCKTRACEAGECNAVPVPDGQACMVPDTTQFGTCQAGECKTIPTCYDKVKNQDETGIDCGGLICPPCNENGCDETCGYHACGDTICKDTSIEESCNQPSCGDNEECKIIGQKLNPITAGYYDLYDCVYNSGDGGGSGDGSGGDTTEAFNLLDPSTWSWPW